MKNYLNLLILAFILIVQGCSSEPANKSYYPKIGEEDKKEIERIESILKENDESLCSLFTKIVENEDKNIASADKTYPDFGLNHSKLVSDLDEKFRIKIQSKYSLSDSDLSFLTLIGLQKCQ